MSKKRREKGEGSVNRRKDGRCVGEYEDANGKRRYVSGKTKAEVRAKLRTLLADTDEGVAYDSENLAMGGYLDKVAWRPGGFRQRPYLAALRRGREAPPQADARRRETR
jgi:hypothetical protein